MIIYLVGENVDLGYHVVSAHVSKDQAEAVCAELEEKERSQYIKAMMAAPFNRSQEQAVNSWRRKYEVHETELVDV